MGKRNRKRKNGSCPVNRGIPEEMKVLRGSAWGSCMASRTMVISRASVLLGPMSGFMALMYQGSLLMSVAPDTTKGQENRAVWS